MNNKKQQNTFLIHDYETFGKNPALDLPAQFAGVRTDSNFNIIEEPLVIYCRPSDDYLPDPEAVMITGITPQFALARGLSEAKFAKQIHQMFSVPGTCIMGYNNIRFDDEVTRNIFYRNFYDPYDYIWKNGNSRWDLLDVIRACYALRPEGINWPCNAEGLPSFKLDHLSKSNGIKHEHAHDAMADVYATIELAKLVRQAQPNLFKFLLELRNKDKVSELINIANMKPLVHISSLFGRARYNTSLVTALEWHPKYKNTVITCDLAGDVSQLLTLDEDSMRERFYRNRIDLNDHQLLPSPLKLIHINKCPVLAPYRTVSYEGYLRLGLDLKSCMYNLQLLCSYPELRKKVIRVFSSPKPSKATDNVYDQLYDGLFSDSDRIAMQIIRETLPRDLSRLSIRFEDKRIVSLLFRYRARNFPETLSDDEEYRWQLHRQRALKPEQLKIYISRLNKLSLHYKNDHQKNIQLKELLEYVQQLVD
ncbi:exodeoxyribonuclease I [Candidatus Profftia tarda]|uniref:Exodeoxyribonuclease I n=1 Tax=Candidatus Profftia tarda TaxID=1177216 RepID=A0A8E4F1E5_9ENTR|nr:exodeoxyribonuclease I [Candidatus Profftia tarda]CAD6508084.1 Exodeoxyribonuclease I [Candidatus Profftia tarda]